MRRAGQGPTEMTFNQMKDAVSNKREEGHLTNSNGELSSAMQGEEKKRRRSKKYKPEKAREPSRMDEK